MKITIKVTGETTIDITPYLADIQGSENRMTVTDEELTQAVETYLSEEPVYLHKANIWSLLAINGNELYNGRQVINSLNATLG